MGTSSSIRVGARVPVLGSPGSVFLGPRRFRISSCKRRESHSGSVRGGVRSAGSSYFNSCFNSWFYAWFAWAPVIIWTVDIHTDPSYCRTMEPNVVIGSNLERDVTTAPCGNPGLSDPDRPSSSNLVPCLVLTQGSCNYEPPPHSPWQRSQGPQHRF